MSIFRKKVGSFTISVSPPLPMWVEIEHDGGHTTGKLKFTSDEVQDLIYALRCAEIDVCAAGS